MNAASSTSTSADGLAPQSSAASSSELAKIDRRVKVLSGTTEVIHRISELQKFAHVVLLAEPGMGKTSVLKQEAARVGVEPVDIAIFMGGLRRIDPHRRAFLDALDVYRQEGDEKNRDLIALAARLIGDQPPSWWISCRSVDWKQSDLALMQKSWSDLVVAHLLPLEEEEGIELLRFLKRPNPEEFWHKAREQRAGAFLRSPLSLKFLAKVVTDGGKWPKTRYDLFEQAVQIFATEPDPNRPEDRRRPSSETIIEAAQSVCLVHLLTQSSGIWSDNGQPKEGCLANDGLGVDQAVIKAVLDTPMFVEHPKCVPMHQALAEFLAGAALAKRVANEGPLHQGLSFRRARAFLVGSGQRPASNLRGVHAWFAAHLSRQGNNDDQHYVERLIAGDPAGVLSLGDASVLKPSALKHLLECLRQYDPLFLASVDEAESWQVCASLVNEDMANDLCVFLSAGPDGTHLPIAILRALANDRPLEGMRDFLRQLALCTDKPLDFRLNAIDAWLNGLPEQEQHKAAAELFEVVAGYSKCSASQPRVARLALLMHLASFMGDALTSGKLAELLQEFSVLGPEAFGEIDPLDSLQIELQAHPRPDLLDTPLRPDEQSIHQIDDFLEFVLLVCIRKAPPQNATVLWTWLRNTSDTGIHSIELSIQSAVAEWASQEQRRTELMDALVADPTVKHPTQTYMALTGKRPDIGLVTHLLKDQPKPDEHGGRRLDAAVDSPHPGDSHHPAFVLVMEYLTQTPGCESRAEQLRSWHREFSQFKPTEYQDHSNGLREHKDAARRNWVQQLAENLDALASGYSVSELDRLAKQFLNNSQAWGEWSVWLGAEVRQAVAQGWQSQMRQISEMTVADFCSDWTAYRHGEQSVLACVTCSLDMETGLSDVKVTAALVVLKLNTSVSSEKNTRLGVWAARQMDRHPSDAGEALCSFWHAVHVLRANGTNLWAELEGASWFENPQPSGALAVALAKVLRSPHFGFCDTALLRASRFVVGGGSGQLLANATMLSLAEEALVANQLDGARRVIWQCLAFGLAPSTHLAAFEVLASQAQAGTESTKSDFIDACLKSLSWPLDNADELEREKTIIRCLGQSCDPEMQIHGLEPYFSLGFRVRQAITSFSASDALSCTAAFAQLLADESLGPWHSTLRQAQTNQARRRSEKNNGAPDVKAVLSALDGQRALNAADIRATICDMLDYLADYIRKDPAKPWTLFWNTDQWGRVVDEKVENVCRDTLMVLLTDRLSTRHHLDVRPEVAQQDSTRVDLEVTQGQCKVPVEIKRAHHEDVWTAERDQLARYRKTAGTDDFGILLVFWFGGEHKIPPRKDKQEKPTSVDQMKSMLQADIPLEDRAKVEVIVIDVHNPKASVENKAREKGRT